MGLCTNRAGAEIVFVLNDETPALDKLNNGDLVSSDGVDLVFSNVVVSDGSSHGDVEEYGILLSSTTEAGFTDVISFDFSFSQDVYIDTYVIGAREDIPVGSFFTASGVNGTSDSNLIPVGSSFSESQHTFLPGTIPYFEAGQVYSFTHNLPSVGDPLFNLKVLSVTAVPEPGSVGMLAAGALAMAIRRKRKASRGSDSKPRLSRRCGGTRSVGNPR